MSDRGYQVSSGEVRQRAASNGADLGMRATIPCPYCKGATRIRTNRPMSSISRELFMYCTNIEECGATFRATIALLNTVSPGARFDSSVPLAISAPRKRAANDDTIRGSEVPRPANDDDRLSEASG